MKNKIARNISLAIALTFSPYSALADISNNEANLQSQSTLSDPLAIRYDHAWKVSFAQDHAQIVQQIPDLYVIAANELKKALEKHGYHDIDPDKTFFNVFDGAVSSHRSYDGWENFTQPKSSYTLTEAAILNVFNQFRDFYPGEIESYSGVYKQGMGANHYNEDNDVRLLSAKLWNITYYYLDIQASYTAALKKFWQTYGEKYTHLMRDSFVFSAYQQYQLGLLDQAQYQLANAVIKGQRSRDVYVYRFDIYGYDSTDILVIEQQGHDAGLLYIPGSSKIFIPFNNERHLKKIIYKEIKNQKSKLALAKHFSLYDRQDGTIYSGINSALNGLANRSWKNSYLMEKKHPIYDDVFARLTELQKSRMASDGDTVLKSNSESERDYILSTTYSLFTVLPIMDVILPELGIPITLAIGSTQLGLSIDQSINGDTLAERLQGTKMTVINSVLLAATAVIPTVAKYGRNVSESLVAVSESMDNQILLNPGITESEIARFTNIQK